MAGGLLNLVAIGNGNVFLMGNPATSFFKVTYAKHTNFGLQKFRIDYDGLRTLRATEKSTFSFKVPRYADLLMDTYVCLSLPDIWSPIYHPCLQTDMKWSPYDFRWIQHLGTNMITDITITCGGSLIQQYSGEYISAMVERDFSAEKKALFHEMSGHVPELFDPANANGRLNAYPSAYQAQKESSILAEPSIRGRMLYIPLNTWFCLNPGCAVPLIALQYSDLYINVTFRPIQELFQIRDVFDGDNNYPYIQPDFNSSQFQMYRFLQSPPQADIGQASYENMNNIWNADIHLLSTYCFLSDEERAKIAIENHAYLIKEVHEYRFHNLSGSCRLDMNSTGMISSWMWYFQRNDVNMRNEWSNYTNWAYRDIVPSSISVPSDDTVFVFNGDKVVQVPGPMIHPSNVNTGYYVTGQATNSNQKEIMQSLAILFSGDYRETLLHSGVFNYIEKYVRTAGHAVNGLYCYQFCLDTDPRKYQPSGSVNLSKFNAIHLELSTILPSVDAQRSMINILCDTNGNPIGTTKNNWRLFEYTFNMTLFEERYNVISFIGGNCGMLYAR